MPSSTRSARARVANQIRQNRNYDPRSSGFRPWMRSTGLTVIAIEAVLVVHLPFFRVRQHIVRFLQLLKLFFGGFVAGIQIGMIFPCQLAKSRTNLLGIRLPRNPQQFVIVLFLRCRHIAAASTQTKICRGAARCAPVWHDFGRAIPCHSERSAEPVFPCSLSARLSSALSCHRRPRTRRQSRPQASCPEGRPQLRPDRRAFRRPPQRLPRSLAH